MATTHTASAVEFDGVISTPESGDRVTAASVYNPDEELANGLKYEQTQRASLEADKAEVPTDEYTFADSTGVTLNNGTVGGSAAVTGGVCRVIIPAGTIAWFDGINGYEGPSARVSLAASPYHWLVLARYVSSVFEANTDVLVCADDNGAPGTRYAMLYRPNATELRAQRISTNTNLATGAAGVFATDGTGWMGLRRTGTLLEWVWGTGTATTPPTRLSTLHVLDITTTLLSYGRLALRQFSVATVAQISADLDDLTLRYLGDAA